MNSASVEPLPQLRQNGVTLRLDHFEHDRGRGWAGLRRLDDHHDLFDVRRIEPQFLLPGGRDDFGRQHFHFGRGQHAVGMRHDGGHSVRGNVPQVQARLGGGPAQQEVQIPEPGKHDEAKPVEVPFSGLVPKESEVEVKAGTNEINIELVPNPEKPKE